MPETQEIVIPFNPHPFQVKLIEALRRFTVFVCHRRFGKSTLMVNLLLKWALMTKREDWKGAYIAPLRYQAKTIAWDYLNWYARDIPGVKFNIAELMCQLPNGSRIYLLGADNPEALKGTYWNVVIFDEYADMKPQTWTEVIRPALVDRKGWAIFIGTPKGKNHFWEIWNDVQEKHNFQNWNRVIFKISDTSGLLDPEEVENAKRSMAPEEYEQEFECSWEAALIGAYYGSFMADAEREGRTTLVPYDPLFPVHTAWDLGVNDATAIWFFQTPPGDAVRVIDYEYGKDRGLETYIQIIKDKKYIYGYHLAPHDIEARENWTALKRKALAEGHGLLFTTVPKHGIADGIQAVRTLLPRCWFNLIPCSLGLEALKAYRKQYSRKMSAYSDRPYHDWASDPADAFRTMAMGLELVKGKDVTLKIRTGSDRTYREHGWMM